MTAFEAGFLSYTAECGLSEKQAAYILQRASDYENVQNMCKSAAESISSDYSNVDVLHNLAHQDLIDREMTQAFKRINT